MDKKKIIAIVLIIILLVASISVFIIGQSKEKKMAENLANLSTNTAKNVDNNDKNTSVDEKPDIKIKEEELELTGEQYMPADVHDVDGNVITLEQEENKPMIILYWNTTEDTSMQALKDLQSYYKRYKHDVTFSAVTVLDDYEAKREEVDNFIAENNIEIPIVFDSVDNSMSNANNVSNVPTLLVVNKNGEIINNMINNITADAIHANLDIIIENY